ncbi:hypothetical protein GF319_04915 [Candidatus Bathyarchaeota archaeon]|nr:hypothetical protein [Candidatus Bathyarchaeota archaeon]
MAKVVKLLGLLVISIIIAFIPTFIIANSFKSSIGSTSMPYFLWGILSIVITLSLRRLWSKGLKRETGSWESPEQMRAQVINTPQFVGRFDKDRGLLESTARMVEPDRIQYQTVWMSQPKELSVIRFRGEILDQNGSPLEYIPVEIKGENRKWVGNIVDGDRVRVEGEIEKDGILHSKTAFNYSTNSWVGERR